MANWRLATTIASLTLGLGLSNQADAWGIETHRAIARVAEENLTDNAKRRVGYVLGRSAKLEDAAGWSDTIVAERPDTEAWHSITLPTGAEALNLRRDCPVGDCVTVKLRDYLGIVRLAYREKPKLIEGFKFLVDLAGDLNQPLNVGKPPSEGVEDRTVRFEGQTMSLYEAWDEGFLEEASTDDLAAKLRLQITHENKKRWSRGHIKSWTWETHQTALKHSYEELPGEGAEELSPEYVARARAVCEEQLAKAAVRLAALINEVWP